MIFEQRYQHSEHFYALQNGRRVGEFRLCWETGGDSIEIWSFEVYRPFRRKGHADRMMHEILRVAKRGPFRFLRLYVKRTNRPAVKLYKSWDFIVAAHSEVSGDYTMTRFIDG